MHRLRTETSPIANLLVILAILLTSVEIQAAPVESLTRKGVWQVGISPVYSYVVVDAGTQPDGYGGSMFIQAGITEDVFLTLNTLWTGHRVNTVEQSPNLPTGQIKEAWFHVISPSIGLSYMFDLVKFSPSIEAGIGLLYMEFEGNSTFNLELNFGFAFDYPIYPWFSVGAAAHYHAYLSSPMDYPIYFDAGPRAALRW